MFVHIIKKPEFNTIRLRLRGNYFLHNKYLVQEHFILIFARKCSQTNNAGLRKKCS